MAKITIDDILASFASTTSINARFQQVEDEFNNKVLYRDNPIGEPNFMSNDLDMNNNQILNLPTPLTDFNPIRLVDLEAASTSIGSTTALLTSIVDTNNNYDSSNVEGALEEVGNLVIRTYPTLIALQSAVDGVILNQSYYIEERVLGKEGGAWWKAVTKTTENNIDIVSGSPFVSFQIVVQSVMTFSQFGATGDGIEDDILNMQLVLNAASGKTVLCDKDATYLVTDTLDVLSDTKINLNGSTVNFQLTTQVPGFNVQNSDVEIFGGTINVNGTDMGGQGASLSCITAGDQQTGTGVNNIQLHELTVSTNRNNAGGPITIFGECTNSTIENITIPDNADILFAVVCEWGGKAPLQITGHPHNITIRNINIGAMSKSFADPNLFVGAIWLSGTFNITVEKVNAEQANGLVGINKGDLGNTQAPTSYKNQIGKNITVSNSGVENCTNTAIWVSGAIAADELKIKATFENLNIISSNAQGYGYWGIHTKGITIEECDFVGFKSGIYNNVDSIDLHVDGGTISNSDEQGIIGGFDNTSNIGLRVKGVHLYQNNQGASISRFTGAAISLFNTADSVVEDCRFEGTAAADTQLHSITGAISTIRPILTGNVTYGATGAVAYFFGDPVDTDINLIGLGNSAPGVAATFDGCPVFESINNGVRVTTLATIPTVGNWNVKDRFYYNGTTSFIGAVCTVAGSPGTWKTFGAITP